MRNFLYFISGLLIVAGCGGHADKAETQKAGQLIIPDFRDQNNEPLALTGDTGDLSFTGSLIVWDETVVPDQIKRIGDASRAGRSYKSDMARYFSEEILSTRSLIADKTTALDQISKERAEVIRTGYENIDLVRSVLVPVADGWFPKRLNELKTAGSITAADKVHAEAMFGAYCELKLWEFALSSLAPAKFLVRPTPLALCEPYYKEKLYFTDVTLCPAAAPTGGRDYFDCLWQDGVLRSELFVSKLDSATCLPDVDNAYPSRGAAIKSWLGLFKQVLADNREFIGQKTFSEVFISQSFSGSGFSRDWLNLNGSPYEDLGRCRTAFKRGDLAADPAIPAEDLWKFAKLDDLKFIVETTEDQASRAVFKLLPSSGNIEQDGRNYRKLAWYIHAFSERKAASGSVPVSYSDAKFNLVVGVTMSPDANHEKTIQSDPAFADFLNLDDRFVSEDLKGRYNQALVDKADAEASLAEKEEAYKEKQAKLFSNQAESIKAVLDPGATVMFNAFGLNVANKGGALHVALKFADSRAAFVGCLPLSGSEEACAAVAKYKNIDVAFDADSGRLTIVSDLEKPADVGFMQRETTELSTYFNRIDEQKLTGKTLEMQFDLNRLNSSLEFFTGATFIKDDHGDVLYQGSQSGDNLSQRLTVAESK